MEVDELGTGSIMGFRLTAAICGSAAICLAATADGRTAAPRFAYADVFALRTTGDAQISPDGRKVAYVGADADTSIDGRRRSVHLIDVTSKRDLVLAASASLPRWSPDGRRIAYAGRDGTGRDVITVLEVADPSHRVDIVTGGGPQSIVWSSDGTALAFVRFVPEAARVQGSSLTPPAGAKWSAPPRIITGARYEADGQAVVTPGSNQLFIVGSDGGPPRQLTRGDADVDGDPAWMPSGHALVFSSRRGDRLARSYTNARLYRVTIDGAEPVAVSPASLGAREPAVSPKDGRIAFVAVEQHGRDYEPSGLYVVDRDGRGLRRLDGDLDREVGTPRWSNDGRAVYASYAEASVGTVARFRTDGERSMVAAHVSGNDYSVSDNGSIAFAAEDPARPADIAVVAAGRPVRRLTNRNEEVLEERRLAEMQPLNVRSSLDGVQVGAWLTLPVDYREGQRAPLILSIHGGPYTYDAPAWRTADQLYAAAGYAVLHANYRGSTSYGFAFADRVTKDFPDAAAADLMSAVDAAVASGVADPDRLFVTGGSAGGHLTAWLVGMTDRFKAAMAEKPVIDAISHSLTSDQYLVNWAAYGDYAWNAPGRYWKSSPLSQVGRVRTPTMLVVGTEDRRTPVTEAQQFYHALTLRRVPTALVLFPGASHSSLTGPPSQLVREVDITLAWFARFGGVKDVRRDERYTW